MANVSPKTEYLRLGLALQTIRKARTRTAKQVEAVAFVHAKPCYIKGFSPAGEKPLMNKRDFL